MLHFLEPGWSIDNCQERLGDVADLPFVKMRPSDRRVFLHDAMYQACDKWLLSNVDELQQKSREIERWYDESIALLDDTDEGLEQLNLIVDSLLYRLRSDPRNGYHWYLEQAEYAIRAAEVGLDMRLRNELLAFLGSNSPADQRILPGSAGLRREIKCDIAAQWVKRLSSRGNHDKAIDVAETVLSGRVGLCLADDPFFTLARADLAVYYAQALIYSSSARTQDAINALEEIIQGIEGDKGCTTITLEDADKFTNRRSNLILGRAHNNLGYANWMQQRRYARSLKEFQAALFHFRASDLREEMANTNDNMGRVYALLERPGNAESLVDDGIELRRATKRDYRIALSLNSRAILHNLFRQPHRAKPLVEEALGIFDRLEARRGIGLASITLGQTQRLYGELWRTPAPVYDRLQCDRFFSEAIAKLELATRIFTETNDAGRIREPIRLLEAYNELGTSHRERAALLRAIGKMNPEKGRDAERAFLQAVRHLGRAIDLAEQQDIPALYADSCEDLARVYFQQGEFEKADDYLRQAEAKIPAEYMIRQGKGMLKVDEDERVEEFWRQMGKIELSRGHFIFDREQQRTGKSPAIDVVEQLLPHYVYAEAYFRHFSVRSVSLETTYKQLYDRLRHYSVGDLKHLGQQVATIVDDCRLDRTLLDFFNEMFGISTS